MMRAARLHRRHRTQAVRLTLVPLLLLLLLLLCASAIQQSQATLFLVGGACRVGLESAEQLFGERITESGLETPIELVDNLCRLIQRYSLGGILIGDVLPQVRRLIGITARGATCGDLDASFEEFRDVVLNLARISVQAQVVGSSDS